MKNNNRKQLKTHLSLSLSLSFSFYTSLCISIFSPYPVNISNGKWHQRITHYICLSFSLFIYLSISLHCRHIYPFNSLGFSLSLSLSVDSIVSQLFWLLAKKRTNTFRLVENDCLFYSPTDLPAFFRIKRKLLFNQLWEGRPLPFDLCHAVMKVLERISIKVQFQFVWSKTLIYCLQRDWGKTILQNKDDFWHSLFH